MAEIVGSIEAGPHTDNAELSSRRRPVCTIMQACDRLHVSRRTIYNWLAQNKLDYVRTPGGSVRIFIDNLYRDRKTKEFKGNG